MSEDPQPRPSGGPRLLPRGTPLPDDVWRARHRVFLVVAWLAAAAVLGWAGHGHGLVHGAVDALPVALLALAATVLGTGTRRGREAASSAGMLALMTAAAVAVHLSGGLIEAHFLFFVAVGAAASYQTWAPFLTAIGFVVVHHGVLGPLFGQIIFNHHGAQERPWLWALIHGALLAGAAAVGVASWRADEVVRERLVTVGERSGLIVRTVEDGIVALDRTGYVVEANPAAVRLLGPGLPLGRRLSDLLPGVCDEAQMQLWGLEGPSLASRGGLHQTPSAVPVAVVVAPVHGDDMVRAVVTLRDMSSAERADTAERALADLAQREQAQRHDVAALMAAVRPPAITVQGLELAVAYEPAASAPAGGDLYDWLLLPSGEVLLIVVDAMGRGTAATREALAVTSTVRTLAVAGHPLGELVRRAAAVLDVTHPDLLATLLIAVIDPATGRLRLAGGGHPPAILVTATGASEIQAHGLGVGYPDPGSFGTTELVLGEGDTLVLYTDGLVEGTRDITAGLAELALTAAGMPGEPVEWFARRLLTDVATCALEEDDCLAVVIRRPAGAVTQVEPSATAPAVGGSGGFVWQVGSHLSQVRRARGAAAAWLTDQGVDTETVETCTSVISELVANALQHASEDVRLRVGLDGCEVLVEVEDGVSDEPVLRAVEDGATGGRGMHLVAAMTARWGVRRSEDGKTVWCAVVLPRHETPQVPQPRDLGTRPPCDEGRDLLPGTDTGTLPGLARVR